MAFKLITLMVLATCTVATVSAKKSDEHVEFYIKEGNKGELRFLGATQFSNWITNKPIILEVASTEGETAAVKPGVFKPGFGFLKPFGSQKPNRPQYIIVDNGDIPPTTLTQDEGPQNDEIDPAETPIDNPLPIDQLIPQVIAQNGGANRRRVPARRRRPAKRNGNRKVYVIRPNA